jgi:hypothetical protein
LNILWAIDHTITNQKIGQVGVCLEWQINPYIINEVLTTKRDCYENTVAVNFINKGRPLYFEHLCNCLFWDIHRIERIK